MSASGLAVSGEAATAAGAEPLPPPPSPLDPLETTSHRQHLSADCGDIYWVNPDAVAWDHRGWHDDRMRIYGAMRRTQVSASRIHAFMHCRDAHHVFREPTTGEIEVRPETCKDRFCLPCGQLRSRRIAQALEVRMKPAADRLMFITLTVRGLPTDTLAEQIEKLKAAWRGLRKLPGWSNTVSGGAVMLEVKWSKTAGGHWHPHYHIIAEGRWVDRAWLKAAWYALTGDSDQVDVQRIDEPGKALSYVTKYASKPMDTSFTRRRWLLDEAMRTLKGVRLCSLFGTWYGTPLKEESEDDETDVLTTWVYCGSTRDLECRAERGDGEARNILRGVERQLALRHALTERCRRPPPDSLPADSDT